jgi:predicted metal-binding protein
MLLVGGIPMTLPANMDIALYLNISFYAMLGLGLFFGFLRGFKKELFAFVTTVLFYVAFFLTINMAVQFIWTLQIPQLGGWLSGFLPELSGITSLSQALPLVISSRLGEVLGAMTTNEQLLLLADGLGIFVLKLVWTLLYFTIIFVVYKLLCGILRALFMPRRKLDEKYASKNRGLGALFGLLGGAVSVFVTLILLGGFMSIAASMVSFLPESEPDPEEIVLSMPRQEMRELSYSLIPLAEETPLLPPEAMESVAMITDFVQAYQNNWIVQFASQLTMPDDRGEEMELSLYLFDEVLSFDYQANALDPDSPIVQVSLRKELSVFAEIAGMAIDSGLVENPDLGNLTTEQIVAVFDKLAQSDLVTSLLPLGIEFAAEYSDIDIELPREQLYAMDWKGELENLGVIAATLYEIADLAGAFEPEGFDYETITLDGQTIRDFFGVVSESQLITLAAAVAVTPLIEMAGVQAIVVVPADMDWPAEFIAIGTVLGEILDSGITIGDVTSANYVVILQAVAGVDFELILNSKIMTHTLINILSGNAGIAELSLIKVPAGTIWLDQYDNEGHLIANGELRNILLALEALLSIAAESEIDFQTIGQNPSQLLSVIGDLNMDDVDTIFGSAVLVATLSDLLISQDLGGFELIIPDTVLDENGYILKTEFVKLVGSAKVLSANLACDVEDTSCQETGIDINKALTLGETDLDTLLDSDILSATVGHLLYTMTGGEGEESILVVPDEALGDVYQKQVFVACVDRSEIKRIFKAIRTLGIDSMDDIENLGPSTLNEIDTEDNPATTEVDESLEIGDLVASIVIRATITKLLKSMDLGTTVIVVPDAGLEAGKTYLSSQELENTVRAIKLIIHFNTCDLEVDPDCQEVDFDIAAVLNLSDPEIDTLLASSVIRGTIGKYLLEMEDVLVVPDSVQETILVDGVGIAVVEELEIRAIFKAVRALGISNFEEVDFGPSILNNLSLEDDPATPEDESDELDQAKLDDLFGSIVLRATLTDLLTSMELGGTVLVVPDAALEAGQNYLTVAELNGAVKAMKLVITTQTCDLEIDPDCQEVTFEVSTVLDLSDSEIDTLMASQIIRGTLGKYLLDMPEVLTVPGSVTETVIVETAPVTVVKETEIRALLKAVRALGMENFEDVSFNASIINDLSLENDPATPEDESKQLDETKLDDLFGSAILRATVTDLLTDQNLGETSLLVPDTAKNAEGYLTQNELKAVARSLKLVIHTQTCDLEVDPDCVEVEFAMDSVLSMTDPEITTLLASEVIAATIGSYVHDIDSLVIPSTVIVSVSVDGIGQTVVQTDEIHLMLSAVSVLGFTSFDGFSLSMPPSFVSWPGG